MSEDGALVLAAGKGTRMRSTLPKVLHALAGKPMLTRVLDSLDGAGFPAPVVVVGYGADLIADTVGARCHFVHQDDQRGTGHAASVGLAALPPSVQRVLVVHGDEPLIAADTYRHMLALQADTGAAIVLLTARAADTRSFGRVIRNAAGDPIELRQEAELTDEQRDLDEINLGAYIFDTDFLREHLPRLAPHPPKDEYYLTDLVGVATRANRSVAALTLPHGAELMGVNDLVQLELANRILYGATARRLMENGVTIADSAGTLIGDDVTVEPDTVILPFTTISGSTTIGRGCVIGPGAHIANARIGERCRIETSTVEDATIEDDVRIGPYASVGPGVAIGPGVTIGSQSQIKRSTLGAGSRMHHFGYLGDALVGRDVNIGAGTVTCNFDGRSKHRTVIEDGAFIGSGTMLRAPITVGRGGATGAGSVVVHDVPPGATVAGVPARILRPGSTPPETASSDEIEDRAEAQARSGA